MNIQTKNANLKAGNWDVRTIPGYKSIFKNITRVIGDIPVAKIDQEIPVDAIDGLKHPRKMLGGSVALPTGKSWQEMAGELTCKINGGDHSDN